MGWSLTSRPLSYRSWDFLCWGVLQSRAAGGARKGAVIEDAVVLSLLTAEKTTIFLLHVCGTFVEYILHHGIMMSSTLGTISSVQILNCWNLYSVWSWASMVKCKWILRFSWPFYNKIKYRVNRKPKQVWVFLSKMHSVPLLGITWHSKLGTAHLKLNRYWLA